MLRKGMVLLGLVVAVPTASNGEDKKVGLSKNGAVDVFPICGAVAGNLVANCGFETGDFNSWSRSGDLTFTDVVLVAAHSGNYGARFGPTSGLGFIAQTLSTSPGQSYHLSFWLRNAGRPNNFVLYWNGVLISNWIDFADTVGCVSTGALPPGNHEQYSVAMPPATSGATELSFGFLNVPDYYYLDDIVVLPSL